MRKGIKQYRTPHGRPDLPNDVVAALALHGDPDPDSFLGMELNRWAQHSAARRTHNFDPEACTKCTMCHARLRTLLGLPHPERTAGLVELFHPDGIASAYPTGGPR